MTSRKTLRVRVDRDRCQGHGRCKAYAPELFELDDVGNAPAAGDGTVAPGLEEKAWLAKANCLEIAVDVTEEESADPIVPAKIPWRAEIGAHARPPVTDWFTDFDHLDPRWIENPYPIWDALRDTCPVAHTDRFQGVYFPARYEDVRAMAYDTQHFSSRRVIVREPTAPPITSDPPSHRPAKMLLLPAFTPDAVQRHEPKTRDICRELIGRLSERPAATVRSTTRRPVRVIAHMLGIPETEGAQFRRWIYEILELGITDSVMLMRATEE